MRVRADVVHWSRIYAVLVACGLHALPAAASRVSVSPQTQLRTLAFEFTNGRSFGDGALHKVIAQREVGKHTRLRKAFNWLPFVDPVLPQPFVPLELQKDVVRLREFYQRQGFSATDVRYDVQLDAERDMVDVRFLITEGRPFILDHIVVADSTGASPESWLPADQRGDWEQHVDGAQDRVGKRAGDKEQQAIAAEMLAWFRNHGYPYAQVRAQNTHDDVAFTSTIQVQVTPGPRARIEAILVEGDFSEESQMVRNTLPIAEGDWYSAERLAEGQQALLGREIIRSASLDLPPQPQDSTIEVRMRVQKGKTHLVTGDAGYLSDGGLTARGEWRHRNFTGGARTMSVSLVAQTGLWALEEVPERLLRLSPALTLPGVLHPRGSIVLSPYGEYRDDVEDLSWGYGFNTTYVYYDNSWVRTASLGYTISAKDVIEYRAGSDDLDFFEQLGAFLDLDKHSTLSALTLAATLGRQDHPMNPQRLLLFRPSVSMTTPSAWNTSEFWRCDLTTSLGLPLGGGTSFWARFAVGRLFPYGKSIPEDDAGGRFESYVELRDDLFTAGGGGDVRGWDNQLLGPKFPDLEAGADSNQVTAERYFALGGLARISASVELRMPVRLLGGGWGVHAFTDGGRVWTPDDRFLGSENQYDQERFFFASGLGIDRDTPVGPIRLSLAYVLNPSPLDVLKPQEFLNELAANGLTNVNTHWNRRLNLHLAIGAAF